MTRLPITPNRSDRRPEILESCAAFVRELEACYTAPLATPELDEVLARCVPGGYPGGGRRAVAPDTARSAVLAWERVPDENLDPSES